MRLFFRLLFLSGLFILGSCSQILQLVNRHPFQNPTAKVESAKLTSLSFSDVHISFSVKINNPNQVKIDLAGFDYNVGINEHSLVSGRKKEALTLAATDSSMITIPVTFTYKKVWSALKDLADKNNSTYQFDLGLNFDLPILGKVRVPVHFKGKLPLLKLPKVQLKAIRLKAYSWSGADLLMDLRVKSQGGIPLLLKRLNYRFSANGIDWVSGKLVAQKTINSGGETVISVPFKLNFIQMGRAVYNIISGDASLDYNLKGDMQLSADNPMLKTMNINFDDVGKVKISK